MAHPIQWGMTLHEFPTGTKVYEPQPMGFTSCYMPAGKLTKPLQTYLSKEDEQKDFVCINQENIEVDNKTTTRIWIKPQDSNMNKANSETTNKTTSYWSKKHSFFGLFEISNRAMLITAIIILVIKKHTCLYYIQST